jgi:hypothetical protein
MEENHTIVGAKIIVQRNKWNSWGKNYRAKEQTE